jgi:hypothetical protein
MLKKVLSPVFLLFTLFFYSCNLVGMDEDLSTTVCDIKVSKCPVCQEFYSYKRKKVVVPNCTHGICFLCYDEIKIRSVETASKEYSNGRRKNFTKPLCPICRASYLLDDKFGVELVNPVQLMKYVYGEDLLCTNCGNNYQKNNLGFCRLQTCGHKICGDCVKYLRKNKEEECPVCGISFANEVIDIKCFENNINASVFEPKFNSENDNPGNDSLSSLFDDKLFVKTEKEPNKDDLVIDLELRKDKSFIENEEKKEIRWWEKLFEKMCFCQKRKKK